ncbi:MAG: S4 domain-containing protein [Pseudomonadota bacterium]
MTTATRVDKWLWHARFFKTRSKATAAVAGPGIRVNSERCTKASQAVRPGDVLTFNHGSQVRVIRIEAIADRRGPSIEAVLLYTELSPVEEAMPAGSVPERIAGTGRPTKKERREIDAVRRPRS